jgi:hypothetical protein
MRIKRGELPNAPHINSCCIASQLEKKLWRAIPSSDNQRGIVSFSLSPTSPGLRRRLIIRSSEPEISNLKNTSIVDK